MKEKYVELQDCLEKGNIISMATLALMLSYIYKSAEFSFDNILKFFLIGLLLIFVFGGVIYGIKKVNFSFTLNPIKLFIYYYSLIFKVIFYGILFPFFYLSVLIRYGIEVARKNK